MKTISETRPMIEFARATRNAGSSIGFVPTMGALHQGHLSLISKAREKCDKVIVSIYVNPTQFGPKEDLSAYPRPLQDDLSKCRQAGVDCVFTPSNSEIYQTNHSTYVDELSLANRLCGLKRPGHFRGVTTIVLKLFNIVQPDIAVFGRKDAQQARVIQKMVKDLNVPVEIILSDTVREPDGLAMSSRNVYLSPSERKQAASIYKALSSSDVLIRSGVNTPEALRTGMADIMNQSAPDLALEYLEILDSASLDPVNQLSGNILIAVAARIGSTRLIDNIELTI